MTVSAGSRASAGDAVVVTQHASSAPISAAATRPRPGGRARRRSRPSRRRSGSARRASRPSQLAALAAQTVRHAPPAIVERREQRVARRQARDPVEHRVRHAGGAAISAAAGAHLLADRDRRGRRPSPRPARASCRQRRAAPRSSGMWPSSEPDTSGSTIGCSPNASHSPRSSSTSAGVRCAPGSRLTCVATRSAVGCTNVRASATTAAPNPPSNAPT